MKMPLTILMVISGLILLILLFLWIQPAWVISSLQQSSPEVLYAVDTNEPVIALTIDDGPDAESSPLIMDLLKRYNAKATFFLITDHVPGNEDLINRMLSEGHEIGNHMTADEPSIRLSIKDFEQRMLEADNLLSQYSEIRWIRPGSGWYNENMLSVINEHGYQCALGSIYPYDPQFGSAWLSTIYILWKAAPGEIIVLHDYQNRGIRTVKALEKILPELENRGYSIVTLSELSVLGNDPQP